jgi:hypothetical protein
VTSHPPTHAHAACPAPAHTESPRILVACLSGFNNGCLHGRWIDATSPGKMREQVSAVLAASTGPDAVGLAIRRLRPARGYALTHYTT